MGLFAGFQRCASQFTHPLGRAALRLRHKGVDVANYRHFRQQGRSMNIDLNDPQQFTLERVRQLLASGNPMRHNQLRVNRAGQAWLSEVIGGAQLDGLLFRLETWAAGSGCVGPVAADDERWVLQVFTVLQVNWPKPTSDYIDLY